MGWPSPGQLAISQAVAPELIMKAVSSQGLSCLCLSVRLSLLLRVAAAVADIQRDPHAAMKKYANDTEITQFILSEEHTAAAPQPETSARCCLCHTHYPL
jgi:hypothetical protein